MKNLNNPEINSLLKELKKKENDLNKLIITHNLYDHHKNMEITLTSNIKIQTYYRALYSVEIENYVYSKQFLSMIIKIVFEEVKELRNKLELLGFSDFSFKLEDLNLKILDKN